MVSKFCLMLHFTVVICEECHMGFHSYCLRPVMVNIPSSDWVCRECSGVSNSISFSDYSRSISGQQESVLRFLNLPYTTYKDFIHENHEAISFAHSALGFNPNHHNSIDRNLFSVGSFVFVRSPDKHDFRLPIPSDNEEEYVSIKSCRHQFQVIYRFRSNALLFLGIYN